MVQCFVSDWKARDTGHRVWPWPFLGAVMVGLGSGLFSVTPIGQHLEQQVGLSPLLSLRGKIEPPQEVVVIAMRRDHRRALVPAPATLSDSPVRGSADG